MSRKANISIEVQLDENQLPEEIHWKATDMQSPDGEEKAKAMMLFFFDKKTKDTMKMGLWTKDMQMVEMDRFVYHLLRSTADTYLQATNNKDLAEDFRKFTQYFGEKTEIIAPPNDH